MRLVAGLIMALLTMGADAQAADGSIEARVHRISVDGIGEAAGTLKIEAMEGGLRIIPNLRGFGPGPHAFHVHQRPDCGPGMKDGKKIAGLAAGDHYDGSTDHGAMTGGVHMAGGAGGHSHAAGGHGPTAHSHAGHGQMAMRGDLPELVAAADGSITAPVRKQGLTLAELRGRSIMIHAHGEQPSDPSQAKGGGARIACAVVP